MMCELSGINVIKNHSVKTATWDKKIPKKYQKQVTFKINDLIERINDQYNKDYSEFEVLNNYAEEIKLVKDNNESYEVWEKLGAMDIIVSIFSTIDVHLSIRKLTNFLAKLTTELKALYKKIMKTTMN